jgi:hypothetical protein
MQQGTHHGSGQHKAPITTDASGHFTLPHVKLGNQTIGAFEKGVGKGTASVNVVAGGVNNVTITLQAVSK